MPAVVVKRAGARKRKQPLRPRVLSRATDKIKFLPNAPSSPTQILFKDGQIVFNDECCCPVTPTGPCNLCVDNQALLTYALDLTNTATSCCNLEDWDSTYVVTRPSSGIDPGSFSSIGCTAPPGGTCQGTCSPFNINSTQCMWTKGHSFGAGQAGTIFQCANAPEPPGAPVNIDVKCQLVICQRTSDSKYFWAARFHGEVMTCQVTAWFLSAAMDNKPDCINLSNTTLNYLCQVWGPGFTRAMDFSGASLTLRLV